VRRVIEALPQIGADTADVGLLIVGRGHIQSGESSATRYIQESNYLRRVRDALLRLGFDESHTAIGWLRHSPTAGESLQALTSAGVKVVYCIPASFSADGINTLFDIPAQVNPIVAANGIKFISMGAWNADDLAAEEIAAYIRAASPTPTPTRMPSRV
jgi:protoheme ferro-lyase